MPVDLKNIETCIAEAKRFLERAKACQQDFKEYKVCDGKFTAALRRSSMDLTRALAALRKY